MESFKSKISQKVFPISEKILANSIRETLLSFIQKEHPDFKGKYQENSDTQNREIAFGKIFEEVMGKQRKNELDLYRLISQDEGFKIAMQDTLKRILSA